MHRIRTSGIFLADRGRRFTVRGVSYGPFRRNALGEPFPEKAVCERDLALVRILGANTLRVYHLPPEWLCDLAQQMGLRILVGIPWAQHTRFLDSRRARERIRAQMRDAAYTLRATPNLLGYLVGNELSPQIVRWYGKRRSERWLASLAAELRDVDSESLVSYANFPTTEYLETDFADFICFNVYLHRHKTLHDYLLRLQNLAGERPLVLSEFGVDSIREGEARQAELVAGAAFAAEKLGCAGSIVFSFTDEWHTGGHDIEDWAFGLVRADRSPKTSYHALRRVYGSAAPYLPEAPPRVSVVVCAYNEERTLEACLESLRRLRYPSYQVIVVDDGSSDGTRRIAERFSEFDLVVQENRGLSAARNVGIDAASGEIVAFTDADCEVDPDWLGFLVARLLEEDFAGVGGPNLPPPEQSWIAEVVARSPGGPAHVLLSDTEAEHIPGCNMAFWRARLREIDGFDPGFRTAGDDVDVCWRLQNAGHRLGFAPAALVWHRRRHTVRAYLRQQRGYGRAEAQLAFKHPGRFNLYGQSRWAGRIYGGRFGALCGTRRRIYAGRFGSAPFQTLYESSPSNLGHLPTTLEWHAVSFALVAAGATAWMGGLPGSAAVILGMLLLSIPVARVARAAWRAPCAGLPGVRTRLMVAFLSYAGPLARSVACHAERYAILNRADRVPASRPRTRPELDGCGLRLVMSFWSEKALDKPACAAVLAGFLRDLDLPTLLDDGWSRYDVCVRRGLWAEARVQLLVQDREGGRRQLDVGVQPRPTPAAFLLAGGGLAGIAFAAAAGGAVPTALLGAGTLILAAGATWSAIGLARALCGAIATCLESLPVVRLERR